MTERNLRNGWSDKKARKHFFILVTLFHAVAWMMDANRFVGRLDVPGGNFLFGLFCAIVMVIYLAIMIVHRESFQENWYVTLRRIPDYRGKYLRVKLATVLFPVGLYGVYGSLQWAFQRSMYYLRVSEALRCGDVWRVAFAEEVLFPIANLTLFAISLLLLNLVLRNVKKDITGGIAAIGGIGMMVVCKHVFGFTECWQRVIVVSVVIGVEVLFLVRHVYRKL